MHGSSYFNMNTDKDEQKGQKTKNNLFKSIHEPISKADEELVEKSGWMIRSLDNYVMEHKQCTRPRGRLYQLYIDGELQDCKPFMQLKRCARYWEKEKNIIAAANIIRYEKNRVMERIQSRLDNDTWTKRIERPPPNWICPLPEHITENYPDSYLLKETQALSGEQFQPQIISSWCTIM